MWNLHYTGVEIYDRKIMGILFSAQRYRNTKKVLYRRVSIGKYHIGIHRKYVNYGKAYGTRGIEIFSNKYSLGILTDTYGKKKIQWAGTTVNPYNIVIIRLWRIYISRRSPRWLVHRMEARHKKN